MSTSIDVFAGKPWRPAASAALLATLALALGGGCTSLGPMPGMTVANAIPDPRTGVEVGFAAVPGTVLSDGAREHAQRATPMPQLSGWFEPGDLLEKGKGIGVGLRYVGGDNDNFLEPMFRYRTWLDDHKRVALMGVLYGTHASGADNQATYEMTRLGAEFDVDVRATPVSPWVELHFTGGASLTGIWANGSYCMNAATGYGTDCSEDHAPDADVSIQTALPSVHVGTHVDLLRDLPVIHGIRLGVMVAAGLQPTFQHAEVGHGVAWFSTGFQASVGFGGPKLP